MEESSMSEPTSTAPATDAPETTATQGEPADLGDGGKKALDAERKRAATAEREAKALRAKLDQIEQANLSELEKAQRAAAESAKTLADFQRANLRQKVALDKGVPAKWVDRLRGETEEELAADADEILADLVKDDRSSNTPKPDLTQGGRGGTPALNSDGLEDALRSKLGIA
jgi:hypothetical protein